MNKLTRQEIRNIQIVILDEIDRFCRANNIKYMLAYGTLIGAVRHKGFIPWDDDVDVMMTRPEYEKFKKKYTDSADFGFISREIDPTYMFSFGRLYDKHTVKLLYGETKKEYGVCIDVYPMDGAPLSDSEFEQQVSEMKRLNNKRHLIAKIIAVMYKFHLSILSRPIYKIYGKLMDKKRLVIQRYKFEDEVFCACLASSGYVKHLSDNIRNVRELEFEGKKYFVPVGYDAFLREYYGDYMQLPPEDQRVPYHNSNYYWL